MSWDRVEEAVARVREAYDAMLIIRTDNRADSRKVTNAELAWNDALNERAAALAQKWTEADGYRPIETWMTASRERSLGRVLQRYYAEMQPVWAARKEAVKAAAKEARKGDE